MVNKQKSTTPDDDSGKESVLSKPTVKYTYQKNKSQKPRRNKSAFIIFSSEARSRLKLDKEPGLNSNDVMVRLAELWKNLDKEERDRYNQLAKDDKQRYQQELADYAKEYPNGMVSNKTKNNHVKKPCSAYGIYLKERKTILKQDQAELKMADILKIVSQEWKQLDETGKHSFQEKANREKEVARNKLTEAILKDHKKQHVQEPQPVKKRKKSSRKNLDDMEEIKMEINVKTEPSLALNSKNSCVISDTLTKSEDSVLFQNMVIEPSQSDIKIKAEETAVSQDDKQNSIANLFSNPSLDLMLNAGIFIKDKESGRESELFNFINQSIQKPNELLADMLNFDFKLSGMSWFEPSMHKVKSESRNSISQFLNTSQTHPTTNMRSKFLNEAIINALGMGGGAEALDSLLEEKKVFDIPKLA